jgi:hypothetical protein
LKMFEQISQRNLRFVYYLTFAGLPCLLRNAGLPDANNK